MPESLIPELPQGDGSEEVANDAMQLFTIATFNGLCRVIAALAQNGLLTPEQLDNIEDAMTAPLDDPDWRDDSFIADARDTIAQVLSTALKRSRELPEDAGDDDE
jgi:hypothetical protein